MLPHGVEVLECLLNQVVALDWDLTRLLAAPLIEEPILDLLLEAKDLNVAAPDRTQLLSERTIAC